jgi:hypothetical protein
MSGSIMKLDKGVWPLIFFPIFFLITLGVVGVLRHWIAGTP